MNRSIILTHSSVSVSENLTVFSSPLESKSRVACVESGSSSPVSQFLVQNALQTHSSVSESEKQTIPSSPSEEKSRYACVESGSSSSVSQFPVQSAFQNFESHNEEPPCSSMAKDAHIAPNQNTLSVVLDDDLVKVHGRPIIKPKNVCS